MVAPLWAGLCYIKKVFLAWSSAQYLKRTVGCWILPKNIIFHILMSFEHLLSRKHPRDSVSWSFSPPPTGGCSGWVWTGGAVEAGSGFWWSGRCAAPWLSCRPRSQDCPPSRRCSPPGWMTQSQQWTRSSSISGGLPWARGGWHTSDIRDLAVKLCGSDCNIWLALKRFSSIFNRNRTGEWTKLCHWLLVSFSHLTHGLFEHKPCRWPKEHI